MEPEGIEPRVAALEGEVRELKRRVQGTEQDAAAARILAGAADRDVGEFRGEIREFRRAVAGSFNAMRQDFVDLRQDFGALRHEFGDLRQEFDTLRDHVDRGFTEMRGKFDAAAAGQQQIVGLLEVIIADQERGEAD